MRLLILEDEAPARDKLLNAIKVAAPRAEILAVLTSVAEAGKWFASNREPDLIFADIQLADGSSFEVLQSKDITCPVVFATAFDEYLFDAFAARGIDYLLKPIRAEKVAAAIAKYEALREHFSSQRHTRLSSALGGALSAHRERFLVRRGIELVSVPTTDVAYLFVSDRLVFLKTKVGVRHMLDRPLSDIEAELDSSRFFRANRAYIVSVDAIARCRPYGKGKLLLDLLPPAEEEVIVSQERAAVFRAWFGE